MSRLQPPEALLEKWRDVAETAADILQACAVLVLSFADDAAEVVAVGGGADNPYRAGERMPLAGSYCEAVARDRDGLSIPDARAEARWQGAPELGLGLVSCLGAPILQPDGTRFGAICVLDRRPRAHEASQARLVKLLRDGIEADLALLQHVRPVPEAVPEPAADHRFGSEAIQQRYRLLGEHLADDFFLHDDEGRILDVNSRACEALGYTRDELLRMRVWDVSISDPAYLKEMWAKVRQEEHTTAEARLRRKDGTTFPVEARTSCVEVEGRKLFFAVARNVSARVEAEEALHRFNSELEQRVVERTHELSKTSKLLQAVMDGAVESIFVKDLEGRYLLFNRAAARSVGRAAEDVLGTTAEDLFGGEDGRRIKQIEQRVMTTGVPLTVEETHVLPDGERTFLATRSPYRNGEGEIIGLIGIRHDITEKQRAERALRQSEARWAFAVNGAGDGIWDWDRITGHVFYSRRWKAMLGYEVDEIGDGVEEWSDRVHPDDLPDCWGVVEKHFAGETPDFVIEHRMRAKDGSWRWILDRGKAIERAADGAPTRVIGTHTDITERKHAEAELQLQRERLLLATEVSRLGVWDYNMDANTIVCDARCHEIFGVDPSRPVDTIQGFDSYVHPEDVDRVTRQRTKALAAGLRLLKIQFRILTAAGETRWISSSALALDRSETGPYRMVGIVIDITERHLAEEKLREAKETAEAAERAKGEFLATMSHEIRTPMNTVIGMTRLTLNSDLTPKQRNYLEKIDASAKTLLGIINDVLDFSKIEAGGLQLEDTEFAVEAVLESMSAITAVRAEEQGLEFVYDIAADTPRRLRGDPLRLGQVLTNLVSNAVKFTPAGEVVVSLDLVSRDADGVTLRFAVRDTGIGLDEDQIAGLFQRFSQAEAHISRRYGGTGLGLAICKQLVEMMGGRIWVESEPGRGSTFYFTIQAKLPEAAPVGATIRSLAHLKGRRVLIVDDNASAREILSVMVGGFGMASRAVESGAEALSTLQAASGRGEPFDLVLMDWRMPSMDGIETARRIRAEVGLSRLPAVLMVTAYGREEVLKSAEQLGLQGVLIKPVTESVMFNTLQDILMLGQSSQDGETERQAAARRGAGLQALGLAALKGRRVLVVDDNMLNREVASDFLQAAGMEVETAVNGLDALGRLERGAYDAVLMDVHMPEMDGLTAVREIRRHPRWETLPIIALTAQARVEDRAASIEAGMTAHLTKPIDETALYRTLIQLLEPAAPVDEARPHARAAHEPGREGRDIGLKGFDASATLKRFGDDPERLQRLLEGFLHDFEGAVARFDRSLEAGDLADIAALAHAMRGAAGYLNAIAFCTVAEQVEAVAGRGESEAVAAYAPTFRSLLEILLRQVRNGVAGAAQERDRPQAARQIDVGAIQAMVAQARPLIAQGDYAAQSLLDRLCTALAGQPEAALADTARAHYEDLELEAANAALGRLSARLPALAGSDAP